MRRCLLLKLVLLLAIAMICSGAMALELPSDGTYTGTAAGKNGDIICEVTVENGAIAAVTVVSHNETAGLSDPAIEQIPALIVEKQSTDVDSVSGATITSEAIVAAVEAALGENSGVTELAEGRPGLGTADDPTDGESIMAAMNQHGVDLAAKYAPEVKTLENGIQIQRTPTEYDAGGYTQPYTTMAYNNQYLNADKRGCAACHDDLAVTLRNMEGFVHVDLTNDLGLVTDVNACIACHSYSPGYVKEYYQLGTMLHSIHNADNGFTGDCFSCHNMTGDGNGVQLWDNVKYNILRGITDVDSELVSASFSYDQDYKTERNDFFNYYWIYYDNDYTRFAAGYSGNDEGDLSVFDTWTITVNGLVNEEKTWTLSELIAEAPSETLMSTMSCTINPVGGPLFANVEITGIPMSWLLEQTGVQDGVAGYLPYGTDGFATGGSWAKYLENDCYLVYKINGEYLRISDGFPVTFWPIAGSAGLMTKQFSTLTLVNEADFDGWHIYQGWLTEKGWNGENDYYNKPAVGIFHMDYSGIILDVGESYEMSGYALAYDEKITGIEISLDRGQTWTFYETPVDNYNLVQWHYTFTAPAAGAFCVYVRSVCESGIKTPTPQQFLVNVK